MAQGDGRLSRRRTLQLTGGGLAVGLAGCLHGGGGGSADEIMIGATVPQSGPFGADGQNQLVAIELAVEDAQEEGELDGEEVSIEDIDTQSDPNHAQEEASGLINDGADFLVGNISSAVCMALGDLATREGLIYMGVAGSMAATGSNCRPNQFVNSEGSVLQAEGGIGYVMRNDLGETVYNITSDFAWGESVRNSTLDIIDREGGEEVGNSTVPLGAGDFSSALTQARESGADIINNITYGADNVQSLNQAGEFDIYDGDRIMACPATSTLTGTALNPEVLNYDHYYTGIGYYWKTENEANNAFVDRFREKHPESQPPLTYTGPHYTSTRMVLRAIGEEGTADADTIRESLRGADLYPNIFGENAFFRECDHRATVAANTLTGAGEDADPENFEVFNLVESLQGRAQEFLPACDQTGCEMEF